MGNGRQTILDRLRKTFRIDYDDDCLDKWEGIELVTKSLDQQTESRIGMLLVNALLVFVLQRVEWESCCRRSTAIIRLGS